MIDAGTAIGYLDLDISKFKKSMSTATSDLKVFFDETATFNDKLTTLSSSLGSLGGDMTKFATLPLVGLGSGSVALFSSFESGMSEVKAISGATGDEMVTLKDKALEMGAKTKFSASESAEAFKYMAMAGWDSEKMVSAIAGIMDLAAASGEDLGLVSDIVTDSMTAFGLSANGTTKAIGKNGLSKEVQNATHFANVLASASSASNTSVGLMGETFKYVAPVAGALGYSVEDVSLAVGLMANSGIKGSQAGTALRTTMANLVNPTDKMSDVMHELGVSVTDSDGKMKTFRTIMDELRDKMGGMDEATKAQTASVLFGKEAMSGMLAVLNTSDEDYLKLAESINTASNSLEGFDGIAEKQASTMMDNLGGSLEQLGGAVETAGIAIGEVLAPKVREISDFITTLVEKFVNLSDENKTLIVNIGLVVASIGPLMLILSKLISVGLSVGKAVSTISTAFSSLGGIGGVVTSLTTKVLPALGSFAIPIAGIVASVVALKLAWDNNFGGIQEKTALVFEDIKAIFETVMGAINSVVTFTLDGIKTLWNDNFLGIQEIVSNWWEQFEILFTGALDIIVQLFDGFKNLFTGNWEGLWENIKEIGRILWETITGILELAWDNLMILVDNIMTPIIEFFSGLWESVKEGISTAWEGIKEFFTIKIPEIYNTIVDWFKELPGRINELMNEVAYWIGYVIGLIVAKFIQFFTDLDTLITEEIPAMITKVVDWFKELPGKIWGALLNVIQKVKDWIKDSNEYVKEETPKLIDSVVSFFSELPGKIKEKLTEVINKIKEFVTDSWDYLKVEIPELIADVVEFFTDLPGKIYDIGVNMITGLWNGITSMTSWVYEKISGFVDGVIDGVKSGLGIHSPSKVFADIGVNMNEGLINGILGTVGEVRKAMKEVEDAVIETNLKDTVISANISTDVPKKPKSEPKNSDNPEIVGNDSNSGGNVYNFYSPKAIDEAEASRQLKRAQQEIALGFV